jgi:hypothetical protein
MEGSRLAKKQDAGPIFKPFSSNRGGATWLISASVSINQLNLIKINGFGFVQEISS